MAISLPHYQLIGPSYTGSTRALGARRLGSIPSGPKKYLGRDKPWKKSTEILLPNSTNPYNLLRRAGYVPVLNPKTNETSWTRRLGSSYYPRFHLYLRHNKDRLVCSLHLDQKRPIYAGTHAHNAEYEGVVVQKEKERIGSVFKMTE